VEDRVRFKAGYDGLGCVHAVRNLGREVFVWVARFRASSIFRFGVFSVFFVKDGLGRLFAALWDSP
jgi:hypothetical protein